jgi:hypothetical protein
MITLLSESVLSLSIHLQLNTSFSLVAAPAVKLVKIDRERNVDIQLERT